MVNLIEQFNQKQTEKFADPNKKFDNFQVGDTIEVSYRITEGKTSRIQVFRGVVIAKRRSKKNFSSTCTVRKMSSGVGVERKFVLFSPLIENIAIVKRGVIRRAKLYYLRDTVGKASRIKEKITKHNEA